MAKATFPIKPPNNYDIDGVSIIILPDKVIIDTGNRRDYDTRRHHGNGDRRNSDDDRKKDEKKPEKKKDWLNNILDNCQDVVMGTKNGKR